MEQVLGSSSEDVLDQPIQGGSSLTTVQRREVDLSARIKVFGTTCPPKGLSGLLRGVGYKFSEGRMARWLTLMFADRVDVIEGVLTDLLHLRLPNLVGEMGMRSEAKYNTAGFVLKLLGVLVAAGVIVYILIT
jgi:hypothetical protein